MNSLFNAGRSTFDVRRSRTRKARESAVDLSIADTEARAGNGGDDGVCRCADRSFRRSFLGAPILRIPARRPVWAETFHRIQQHLRERLSMYNRAVEMDKIHARAGPCRTSFCENLPRFPGVFRALKIASAESPPSFRNRPRRIGLRCVLSPMRSTNAFLAVIQT